MLQAENYQVIKMRNDYYPPGEVTSLLKTNLITEITGKILESRLETKAVVNPIFFNEEIFLLLHAVCQRLIPQTERLSKVDLAGLFDEQLAKGTGNGWRYNDMPPDEVAYKSGLQGINETSKLEFDKAFILLEDKEQDIILHSVQSGNAKGKTWEQLPSDKFFEELLASLVELYYSHPDAKDETGDISFADARGWQQTGLNELEVYQPLPLRNITNDRE